MSASGGVSMTPASGSIPVNGESVLMISSNLTAIVVHAILTLSVAVAIQTGSPYVRGATLTITKN